MWKDGRVSRHMTSIENGKFRNEYDVNKRKTATESDDTGDTIHVKLICDILRRNIDANL